MKKSKKFVVGSNLVAALCFGIASCGHFSLRRTGVCPFVGRTADSGGDERPHRPVEPEQVKQKENFP